MTRKSPYLLLTLLLVVSFVITACGTATPTAAPAAAPTEAAATGGETGGQAAPQAGTSILFWSTETQPERVAATRKILDNFTAQSGINVEIVPVDEGQLSQLLTASAAANTLPDVMFFPLDYAIGWADQGILDFQTAKEVIDSLGASTFSQGALDMVAYQDGYAAVPSDGWGQLLIYRKDMFDAAGLGAPDTYDKITAAAEQLNDPSNNVFGITAANDVAVFTQQTFEHIALANNCQMTDDSGNVILDSPECVGAISFYNDLETNYSPAGQQDVASTRATYFAGQATMIIWSPFILDEMCGLRDDAFPTCPECKDDPAYLAKNSGFVPTFVGPDGNQPAQYGQFSNMGITTTADKEAAKAFLEFWFNDGYLDWLGVAPEGKLPMRTGTSDEPNKFIDGWKLLETGVDRKKPLGECYGDQVINTIIEGVAGMDRWGFKQGQGALVQAVYQALPVPTILNDVLNGSITPEEAAQEMKAQVEALQSGSQ
jgi:multiple sugar transport system substrate-binding protein